MIAARPRPWLAAADGFSLCPDSLARLLLEKGIADTGLSPINPADTESYFDDWYPYQVRDICGLVKLREQEYDFIPGFSDRDDPAVTVSFVAFPMETLAALPRGCPPQAPEMKAFVSAFRDVTERFTKNHDPLLQAYFSAPASQGSYLIAESYVRKILSLFPDGRVPFPKKHRLISPRLRRELEALNRAAGKDIIRWKDTYIIIEDPLHPTLPEQQAVLGFYTGNLTFNGFAAEVKFHADALTQLPSRLPVIGKLWYDSALRADMQFGPENTLYTRALCPYYRPTSRLVTQQRVLHGNR